MTDYNDPKLIREYAIGLMFHKPPIFSEFLRVGANMKTYNRLRTKEKEYLSAKIDDRLTDVEVAGLWGVHVNTVRRFFYKIREKYKGAF